MKNLIEKIKTILSWVILREGSDGEAHIIACMLLMSISSILVNVELGLFFTISVADAKEVGDMALGDTWKNSVHDLICDGIGIGFGALIYLFHYLKM